ncbi:MAG: phage integrase SAM-like domain-containing protein [Bacteroidota bacterium]
MATVKVTLDKRSSNRHKDGSYPVVLRLGHQSKSRDIPFNIYVDEEKFDDLTNKITGVQNAVRHSKRIQKILGDVDLWLDENKAEIKLWSIAKLKDQIEKQFFKKQETLSLFSHAARVLYRFTQKEKFSTASSYEDALKIFVKYQMKLAKRNDKVEIKTLFEENRDDGFTLKDEYQRYDMPIKAFGVEFAKDFQAYLSHRYTSKNTVNIHLRSLQSILNDAGKSFAELKDHKPLESIKKMSIANQPVVLTLEEIAAIRDLHFEPGSSKFHVKNYFLFMFNNMGMNFIDVALAKVVQFGGKRFSYIRKKTEEEGDYFSIMQSQENLDIVYYYLEGRDKDDYLFPLIPKDTEPARIFRVKKDRAKWFNTHIKQIAALLDIDKNLTTYTPRDTWTNLGLQMGIDIRKISSGLGHSSIEVTQKHYEQSMQDTILDQINKTITQAPKPG